MNDMDLHKKELQELIEARKIKNTVPDSELATKPAEDDPHIVPKTFKEKWANYWFHYKTATFASIIGAVLIFAFVWQITHPVVYDTTVSIVSSLPFDSLSESISPVFQKYLKDYTGNGKVELELATYTLANPEDTESTTDPQMAMTMQMKLVARMSMGEDYLFMVNDFGYDSLKNMSATFVDLSQYSDSSNVTGDKYLLNGTNLMKELGLDGLKDNMYLCFLDISAYQDKVKNNEKIQKKYAEALEYLQTLLDVK